MSIFKDKAIVLKMQKNWDKDIIYTLFSFEYGKIRANKRYAKKEKNLDLWYIINFEIITKENVSIHKIRNIKIIWEFDTENRKNFQEIHTFLEILTLIYKEIPDGVQNKEVFSVIEEIHKTKDINYQKLLLSQLKIMMLFWIINIQQNDLTIEKILTFMNNSKIKDIFRLQKLDKNLIYKLESMV